MCVSLSINLVFSISALLMAPRRELAVSRAQGKYPIEPSQPAQMEACRKTRFDSTLFNFIEDYQRYKERFAKRKVIPRRSINLS